MLSFCDRVVGTTEDSNDPYPWFPGKARPREPSAGPDDAPPRTSEVEPDSAPELWTTRVSAPPAPHPGSIRPVAPTVSDMSKRASVPMPCDVRIRTSPVRWMPPRSATQHPRSLNALSPVSGDAGASRDASP